MGWRFFSRLKALTILFTLILLAWFVAFPPQSAYARANLTAYTTTPPNAWEMKGFNATGTAPYFIVNTLGFNYSNMLGNVGVGNGSLRSLNATTNRVISYTEQYTMAGDVSMAPFDKSRLTSVSVSGINVPIGTVSNISSPEFETAHENTSGLVQAQLSNMGDRQLVPQSSSNEPLCGDYPCTTTYRVLPKGNRANRPAIALEKGNNTTREGNNTTQEGNNTTLAAGQIGGNIPLNDQYHSILLGRPVDDMIYEHPHGIATNAYGRLTGLPLPGGGTANIGLRVLGYGY